MSSLKGQAAFQKRLRALNDTRRFLGKVQIAAVAESKKLVPRKTAFLARSIVRGSLARDHAFVLATAPYAAYVELGTRPHVIRPRNGRMLAWPKNAGDRRLSGRARSKVPGGFIYARVVHHPGTKAQPYLLPGAEAAVKMAGTQSFIDAWNSAA